MKGQGAGGEKMAILGDVLSLATPKGITKVRPEWEHLDFYESLDHWKMHLRNCALKMLSDNLKVHVLFCKSLFIYYFANEKLYSI